VLQDKSLRATGPGKNSPKINRDDAKSEGDHPQRPVLRRIFRISAFV
jgi:hypothetical protein